MLDGNDYLTFWVQCYRTGKVINNTNVKFSPVPISLCMRLPYSLYDIAMITVKVTVNFFYLTTNSYYTGCISQFFFCWSTIPLVYIVSFLFKLAPVATTILLYFFTALVSNLLHC